MPVGKFEWKPLTLTPINVSLTEGTSIPAPLDSPPESPRPAPPGTGPLSSHPTPKSRNGQQSDETTTEDQLQQSRTSDAASAMSPTSPTLRRPASVRKFLGLRTLSSTDSLNSERPGSPATIGSKPSLSRRKSGSWFGKKKTYSSGVGTVPEAKENSTPYTNGRAVSQPPAQPPKSKGPPPPALPTLQTFGVTEDTLRFGADDMFKDLQTATHN